MKLKFTLLLILNLAFLIENFSQTDKGNWLINGRSSFSFVELTEPNLGSYSFELNSKLGYFITDNLAVINESFYSQNRFLGNTSSKTKYRLGLMPSVRFYFFKKKWKPFIDLGMDLQWGKSIFANESKSHFSRNIGRIGFAFFPSKNISLEASYDFRFNENRFPLIMENRPSDGLVIDFKVNYFLTQKESGIETLIYEKYTKKGNGSLEVSGFWGFNPTFLLSSFSFKKFKEDNRRWSHEIDLYMAKDVGDIGFFNIWTYQLMHEQFIPIRNQTYFIMGGGMNFMPSLSGNIPNFGFGGNVFIRPTLMNIFNHSIVDFGLEIGTPYLLYFSGKFELTEEESVNLTLGYELFIQDNLSIRGELIHNLFGALRIGETVFDTNLPPVYFEVGFNYFLSPRILID